MASVLYVGLERRVRRRGDRRRPDLGRGRDRLRAAGRCVSIGLLMVARSDLPRFSPFRTGLVLTTFALALVLGRAHGGYLREGARVSVRQPDRDDRDADPRRLPPRCRRAARQRRLGRRVPAPLGPRHAQRAPQRRARSPRGARRGRPSRSPRRCSPPPAAAGRRRAGVPGRRPARRPLLVLDPEPEPEPEDPTPDVALRRPRARRRGHRVHASRPGVLRRSKPAAKGDCRVQRARRRGARPGARELRRRRDRRRRDRRARGSRATSSSSPPGRRSRRLPG